MSGGTKIRVGVLFGGRSREHEVSLSSARSVLNHIDKSRYDIELIGITHDGVWVVGEDAQQLLDGKKCSPKKTIYVPTIPSDARLASVSAQNNGQMIKIEEKIDIAFPVLHGPFGEDGAIQGLFEIAGIPYVGAGVAASAVCMDKILMKSVFIKYQIPTPRFGYYLRRSWQRDKNTIKNDVLREIGFPCFVKPSNTGSSVGITKVKSMQEFDNAFELAAEYDRKIVVEQAVDAREIECSVLGNDDPEVSVPGEIIQSREFYDYDAKYIDETSKLIIPAELNSETAQTIRGLAVEAYKAVDCSGMARVDFLLDRNAEKVYVNELNTLPGFTDISMYPKLWEESGLSYGNLITKLIDFGFERFEDKSQCNTSYRLLKG